MNDFVTLTCPSCGGQLQVGTSATLLTCRHCGNEHLVRREGGAVMLESYARCPCCGRNDRVEKVTAIRTSQTQQINEIEPRVEVYVDRHGRRQTRMVEAPRTRVQISDLAKRLEPPQQPPSLPEPRRKTSSVALISGIVLVLQGLALAALGACPLSGAFSNAASTEKIITTGVICILPPLIVAGIGILLIVVGVGRNKKSKERHQAAIFQTRKNDQLAIQAWQRAMKRWNELYYCHRDDCVFIPDEGTYAPLPQMQQYVYR